MFHRELRGWFYRSKDQETYLVVKEKDCNECALYVDGNLWMHNLGEKGKINPGFHVITCGGEVRIDVRAGKTFVFNYWGP
jgi:hypothetical protein